jgi:hypothetical protein
MWKTQFEPRNTAKKTFFVGQNEHRSVDMMHGRFNATSGDNLELGCKVLRIPFVGEKLINGISEYYDRIRINDPWWNHILDFVICLCSYPVINPGSRLVWLSDKI